MSLRRREMLPDAIRRRGAIVVVDLDGFTSAVLRRGIAAALRDVLLVRRIIVPIFRAAGGEVYKIDADNEYVFFDLASDALHAASAAHAALAAETKRRHRVTSIAVSIGIGYGDLIYLPGEDDYYGAEFNLASKLGEDTAEGGETLLTAAAHAAVRRSREFRFRRFVKRVSGIELAAYEAFGPIPARPRGK